MWFVRCLKTQWFSVSLLVLLAVAWAWPRIISDGAAHRWIAPALISTAFFFTGLSLRTADALKAAANWRIHLYVQFFSFAVLPAAFWIAVKPWSDTLPDALVIGLYVVGVLPTTITSCVVFTQLAGGSTLAALFNAVFGNLVGIIISPALLVIMGEASALAVEIDVIKVFMKLAWLVALPLAVGQLVRRVHPAALTLARASSGTNRVCILGIAYLCFASLFQSDSVTTVGREWILPLALLVPAHFVILAAAWAGTRVIGLTHPDRVAVLFAATQKTLALGFPLVSALLADRPEMIGPATLPIIVYHATQLVVSGVLVERLKGMENSSRSQ